jgi:hypothetical protein
MTNLLPTAVSGDVQRAVVIDGTYQEVVICKIYASDPLGSE